MVQIPARTARLAGAAAAVIVTSLALGASANAATDQAAGRSGEAASVAQLANEATALLVSERQLLADPDASLADLERVDAAGARALSALDELGADLPQAVRTTLSPLPDVGAGERPNGPQDVVYAAAIEDLSRVVATPEAVLGGRTDDGGRGALFALALGAAVAMVLVGRSVSARSDELDDELDSAFTGDGTVETDDAFEWVDMALLEAQHDARDRADRDDVYTNA